MHTEAILASNIDFRGSVIQFEREALKFCGEKLSRQFSKHLELFKQIDCAGVPPQSRILDVYSG